MPGVHLCCLVSRAHREAPMVGVLLCRSACQALKGAPWVGSYTGSTHQVSDGPVFALFSCQCWCGEERQAMVMAPPPVHNSAVSPCFHDCLAFLLPLLPSVSLSSANSSPRPGIAPQSLHFSPQPLCLPGDLHPCLGTYDCGKDCLLLIPFRLPQSSCFILSLQCFSPNPDNCPSVGIGPLLWFPHPPRAGPVLLTQLFLPLVPSSYQVLRGSMYSFPVVRYSCLLPAGISQVLLCLNI